MPHISNLWGRMTHICVSKQTIIGSDNGLSPGRQQAIIWILVIGPLWIRFSEILIGIKTFSLKMLLKMASGKWRPFCLGLRVLTHCKLVTPYGVVQLSPHQLRWWLVACSAQSQYLCQCWIIVNLTCGNQLEQNSHHYTKSLWQENVIEKRFVRNISHTGKFFIWPKIAYNYHMIP